MENFALIENGICPTSLTLDPRWEEAEPFAYGWYTAINVSSVVVVGRAVGSVKE